MICVLQDLPGCDSWGWTRKEQGAVLSPLPFVTAFEKCCDQPTIITAAQMKNHFKPRDPCHHRFSWFALSHTLVSEGWRRDEAAFITPSKLGNTFPAKLRTRRWKSLCCGTNIQNSGITNIFRGWLALKKQVIMLCKEGSGSIADGFWRQC